MVLLGQYRLGRSFRPRTLAGFVALLVAAMYTPGCKEQPPTVPSTGSGVLVEAHASIVVDYSSGSGMLAVDTSNITGTTVRRVPSAASGEVVLLPGDYEISFPGVQGEGGVATVEVSSSSEFGGAKCFLVDWRSGFQPPLNTPSLASELVHVRCFDLAGEPTDADVEVGYYRVDGGWNASAPYFARVDIEQAPSGPTAVLTDSHSPDNTKPTVSRSGPGFTSLSKIGSGSTKLRALVSTILPDPFVPNLLTLCNAAGPTTSLVVTTCAHVDLAGQKPAFSYEDSSYTAVLLDPPTTPVETDIDPGIAKFNDDIDQSMNVGTFNIQAFEEQTLLAIIFSKLRRSNCCDDWSAKDKAQFIANRVRAADLDVVAFNEVADDEMRTELAIALGADYPNIVYLINPDDWLPISEDSELMLFSRFPFEAFPGGPPPEAFRNGDVIAAKNGEPFDDVYFANYEFGDCTGQSVCTSVYQDLCNGLFSDGSDCLASKSAGLVRVRHPNTEEPINIVFTHIDAGAGSEDKRVRKLQIGLIDLMLDAALGPAKNTEQVIFMGDLNIMGEEFGAPASEYSTVLGPSGSLVSSFPQIRDPWLIDNTNVNVPEANRDSGLTSSDSGLKAGNRLDYILYSGDDRHCVQHQRVAYEMNRVNGTGSPLSDHFPVVARILPESPFCSPSVAREVTESDFIDSGEVGGEPLQSIFTVVAEVDVPGAAQWFLLPRGTFTMAVGSEPGDPFKMDLYKSSDMSTPVHSVRQNVDIEAPSVGFETDGAETFRLDSDDYFLKVSPTQRVGSGRFQLAVAKHSCSSPKLAIELGPGSPVDETVPWNLPVNPESGVPSCWFRYSTVGTLDQTETQVIDLAWKASDAVSATVVQNSSGHSVISQLSAPMSSDFDPNPEIGPYAGGGQITSPDADFGEHLIRMDLPLNRVEGDDTEIAVSWRTNLTIYGANLEHQFQFLNKIQTDHDFFGEDDDNVTIQLKMDTFGGNSETGTPLWPSGLGRGEPPVKESWDTGREWNTTKFLTCAPAYVRNLLISASEEDYAGNPNDFLTHFYPGTNPLVDLRDDMDDSWARTGPFDYSIGRVQALVPPLPPEFAGAYELKGPDLRERSGRLDLSPTGRFSYRDGWYRAYGIRTHDPNQLVGSLSAKGEPVTIPVCRP